MKDPIRVTTLTRIWKSIRRSLARNEWAVRLLGLPSTTKNPVRRGLILVQIDGLSEHQLEQAIADGNMPFLGRLRNKERYKTHALYSGLPANTSAVQAELFYGEKCIVPSFGFRDHRSGKQVRMHASDFANELEGRLKKRNAGLLQGGSSYCNIYGGGADEAHFCATSTGWDELFVSINPLRILLVILMYVTVFLRTLGLLCLELTLAIYRLFQGALSGAEFWQELTMIPARVLVVVFLRELVVAGASHDAARGTPIIQLNLLGYDEQAHRRGPGSKFAHWTLKGIDRAIARLWTSAHRSEGREYDLWIFSGHGQVASEFYQPVPDQTIQHAVIDTVQACSSQAERTASELPPTKAPSRAHWLGIGGFRKLLFRETFYNLQEDAVQVQVMTSGSLAFVYLLTQEARQNRHRIANQLVTEKQVPMAVLPNGPQSATVITNEGEFELPRDSQDVFGTAHPFLQDIPADLIQLVNHADAGNLTLLGWKPDGPSLSFTRQKGTHSGPSRDETSGFAMLPCDVHPQDNNQPYLRPISLRQAVQEFMDQNTRHESIAPTWSSETEALRILTYNVHACVGMDGQLAPDRIARVIAQAGAHVVCLQELDVNRHRSEHIDQAREIARLLGMNFQFHPAWKINEEQFGNAILTKLPMRLVQGRGLHQFKDKRSKRSAVWTEIELSAGISIQVISAHLSLYPKEQLLQVQELYRDWVQPAEQAGPVVLCGDFNARPASAAYRDLSQKMQDAETLSQRAKHAPTYFSPRPLTRLDHIFVNQGFEPQNCQVITTRLAQEASDHLPLMAELKIRSAK